ncbi:hypothetical protein HMPREF3098_05585 [Corynebacterium sp. HMSC28B08]|nr:hypothetical protein HMPREF3098_05585 [Corynebacterium sp. HMSC28B08]
MPQESPQQRISFCKSEKVSAARSPEPEKQTQMPQESPQQRISFCKSQKDHAARSANREKSAEPFSQNNRRPRCRNLITGFRRAGPSAMTEPASTLATSMSRSVGAFFKMRSLGRHALLGFGSPSSIRRLFL